MLLYHCRSGWILVLACLLPYLSLAQLRITSPVPRMVFQRTLSNEATITVTGIAPSTATSIQARFVPLTLGQGSVTAWTAIDILPNSSSFRGQVTVSAGWYRLDVRAKAGTTLLTETHVNRIGVGEVFVIAGQSNAYGGFERVPSSVDDRVSCIDFRQDSLSEQLLPLAFSHISYGTNIGPSQPPHIWSLLGDKLAQRLNVPVLFIGAALGGTNSFEWQQSAAGNIGASVNAAVYRRLGAVLLHYVRRTGARAVLWHQGESDLLNNTTTQAYFDNIQYVINKSRQQLGQEMLPWMVARASFIDGRSSPAIIAAQNRLIAEVPRVYAGPATDTIQGPDKRPDGLHFRGAGFFTFTNSWDQSLTADFFSKAVPFTPTDESALITSGYTLPLTRRPGETIIAASLRSDAHEFDNLYRAQVLKATDNTIVYESPASSENPLLVTLPTNLADGTYRLRTLSNHPVTTGALGEPFMVRQSAPATPAPQTILRSPVASGVADAAITRIGYRYEMQSHGFYFMVQADAQVEIRMERIDGGGFNDAGWYQPLPSSQLPDYAEFADFNYLRNYPPTSFGVGGVEPGRYRLSVRRQGTTGSGVWFDATLLDGRQILYFTMEPIAAIPPVVTITSPAAATCLGPSFPVAVDVTDGTLNGGNTFSVRLSDATGSFASETTIGSGPTSPIQVTLPSSLPGGSQYRIRVVASNPAVASAPSEPLSICAGADLSLAMRLSNRTPLVGQPVTVTLVLTNTGPQPTANVTAGSLLPDGLVFLDSSSPTVSASPNAVNISAGSLASGASTSATFRLRATRSGSFATAAQITASSVPDPDSQPNSGTGDGQDDEALVDLRTLDSNGSLTVSPNPNQTPLPPVQSSQPPTSSANADLSLSLVSDRLTLESNQISQLTLTVSNRGGATASNVSVQTLLPAGWQLTNTNGLTVSGQTVNGTISSIAAGGSATLTLSVRVTSTGLIQAQIGSATPADPDSTPGNGYTTGEDDEASVSLRIR
ncbi:sialate O-acetylesterase [Spirosoma utsteinense]|uniref:Repeat protein (TIGR01451 family) n=1 Tax=Spirosoma utsteinense TaxID=2585773 RepID=A0ABR6WAM5_9BACT|nr:sialate O-acetylesterase [Spirosoma utsteinense]MBC3787839.1 putative repeat protein (TIGR01451 family) [Spirosoma utsteinense]MBC3793627.1 putative repeat protein (TIGR01451 family) [Spirosoma utsteinense]